MMPHYLLLGFVLAFTKAHSNKINGYIVTHAHDTIQVQLKVRGRFWMGKTTKLNKKIKVADSLGGFTALTPKDIKAFGYSRKGKNYAYESKPIKSESYYFLEPLLVGSETSLYHYRLSTKRGSYEVSTKVFYTFEKKDGTYMFLTNYSSLKTFREELKSFYRNLPAIQGVIETKFEDRRHIQRDVTEVLAAVNGS